MSEPLVSVLLSVYNCERTLPRSLESILAQDYGPLEAIVCDDGSADGTLGVARAFAARDARVRVLANDRNLGLARSLNRCAAASSGTYLARMDGDDVSRPDRIRAQVGFLEAHPEYALCGSSIRLFDEGGTWGKIDYPERPDARSFLLRSPFAHPSVVFRSSCLASAGGYDGDPSIGRSEDYDLFMRIYEAGGRGYNIQDYLLEYREEARSYKRRAFRYALAEARVRFRGFRRLGLMPRGLVFAAKPVLIALLPKAIYARARRAVFS